jgi:hypothetical protein
MKLSLVISFVLLSFSQIAQSSSLSEFMAKRVRLRAQWGAQDARSDMASESIKKRIAIHHTAGVAKSADQTVRDIQRSHMVGRSFSDIGYNFLIAPNGTIFEGRDLVFRAAHVTDYNTETLGISFLGCYDSRECHAPAYPEVHTVNEAALRAAGELAGVLCLHFGIAVTEENIKGHRQFQGASTACPGDRIMARMRDIRAEAMAVVTGQREL